MNKIKYLGIYELIEDFDMSDTWRGIYKNCFLPKGTKLRFIGKSLYAHFELLERMETWKDGKDKLVLIPYSKVFKILEEVDK